MNRSSTPDKSGQVVLLGVTQCQFLLLDYTEGHREDTENHRATMIENYIY
jgi:hypothetical protein